MIKTFTIISSGDKSGWIIGGGNCQSELLKDEPTIQVSIEENLFNSESPILFKATRVDDRSPYTVSRSKEAVIFYLEKTIESAEHEEFYNTYLKNLANTHGFSSEESKYETKRLASQTNVQNLKTLKTQEEAKK